MLDDFQIIRVVVPRADEIKLYPIADVHYGSIYCNEKAWMDFRDRIANEENSYVVLVGDLVNNNLRSSVGSPYEDVIRPMEQKRMMVEMLRPLKSKIIGAVSGNHEKRSLREADDDVMYDILTKLDLEPIYRQNSAFIHLCIGERTTNIGNENEKTLPECGYMIAVLHGSGGGTMTGGSVNKVERFQYSLEGVDALITGHTHKGSITRPAKLTPDMAHGQMVIKPTLTVQAVSWQAYGGYALQKMMSPNANASDGEMVLHISGNRRKKYIKAIW